MSNIVERLRGWNKDSYPHNWEAADTIERLRAALQEIAGVAENNTVLIPAKVAEFARRTLEPKT